MMNPRIQAPTFQPALLNTGQERVPRVKPPASSFFCDYPQRMEIGRAIGDLKGIPRDPPDGRSRGDPGG